MKHIQNRSVITYTYGFEFIYIPLEHNKVALQHEKMAPRGQQSERRLATTSHDDSETNWNRWTDRPTDGQDHVLSQSYAITKNLGMSFFKLIPVLYVLISLLDFGLIFMVLSSTNMWLCTSVEKRLNDVL